MPMQKVNWGAVIVGAIVFWVWGAIWFTLLKAPYAAAVGFTADQVAAYSAHPSPVPYILSFVAALVLSMGTAIALADSNQPGAAHGVQFGMFMGIIVFATNFLSITLYMMKPWSLWFIECGYVIIGMMIVGGIIGAWRRKAASA